MNDILRINTTKGNVYVETTTVSMSPSKERSMNNVGFNIPGEQIMTLAQDVLDKSLDSLNEIADKIAQKLKALEPNKVEVEFGFKISGTGDLFIAKCTTEGNFTIKLTWEK